MKPLLLGILALLASSSVWSQTISEISGNLEHGSSLVITGDSFGTKPQAQPLIWENVESGEFNTNWGSTFDLLADSESPQRHPNSNFLAFKNFQGTDHYPSSYASRGYFQGSASQLSEKWFAQYWFKLGSNWVWGTNNTDDRMLANVKFFRFWNLPGTTPAENFVMATRGYASGNCIYTTEHITPAGGGYFEQTANWTLNEWHLFQFQYSESGVDQFDGTIRVWRNGQLVLEDTQIKTRQNNSNLKWPLILGFYDSWHMPSRPDPNFLYLDDVYLDTTWARVEIGNAPSYGASTHREIQIPTEWTNSQITIELNLGSITDLETFFVFVIDESGSVSQGFPLIPDDQLPPGAPTIPVLEAN
jgi:hypothetical protein